MTTPQIVDQDAWKTARLAHLAAEKKLTEARDELSRTRRELPWLEVTEDYRFAISNGDGEPGERSLSELFDGLDQLILYHFMMGPDWDEGCPSCSFWADNYNGTVEHLAARSTALVAVSRAPLSAIETYRTRMGWSFPWVSSLDSTFNFDFAVSFTDEQLAAGEELYNHGTQAFGGQEAPGISVFRRIGDRVYLTYQTFSRGLDMVNGTYHLLDLTSKGRDEDKLPWPMAWLQRRDRY